MPITVSSAVEGDLDEVVVRKLIQAAGAEAGIVYGKSGKAALKAKIQGYNNAARHSPWFVLVDLDTESDCAPNLRTDWLENPEPHLCFRVAVRQVESWLIGDAQALAEHLSVAVRRVPNDPDSLEDAKLAMVNIARRSRRMNVREDMVPREGSGRAVGPAYTSRLIEFVEHRWRPGIAAAHSESLRRAIACLERLIGTS